MGQLDLMMKAPISSFRRRGRPAPATAVVVVAVFSFIHPIPAADRQTGAVQEGLKKRGFYFGQVNGVLDDPTKEALKRFQIREGLSVSGEIDNATVAALQKTPPPSGDPSLQKAPARERAQSVLQSDQDFLDKVEAAGGNRAVVPERQTPAPVAERIAPASPESTIPSNISSGRVSETEAREFVESYVKAAQGSTPAGELAFYGDQVDYFDSGKVSRAFIENDQRNYYRRWPVRNFDLVSPPEMDRASGSDATLRFRIRYTLRGAKGIVKGQTENVVHLRKAGDALKIVGIRERKIRD